METILAIFIWLGTILVAIERLQIFTNGVSILSLIPLTIFGSNPSHPAALFFKLFKIMFTSFSSTGENIINSFTLSLTYSTGQLLLLGIGLANVGPMFVKKLLNLVATAVGSSITELLYLKDITFFISINNHLDITDFISINNHFEHSPRRVWMRFLFF